MTDSEKEWKKLVKDSQDPAKGFLLIRAQTVREIDKELTALRLLLKGLKKGQRQ